MVSGRVAPGPLEGEPVKATHALFGVHVLVFLALLLGSGSPWQEDVLAQAALHGGVGLIAQPWTLLSYVFLSIHPLEFVLSATILLLVGPPLEERLGRAGFLGFYALSVVLVGLAHLGLRSAGVLGPVGGVLAGALGGSAALMTGYLFLLGPQRSIGSMPFPIFYLFVVLGLGLTTWVVHSSRSAELTLLEKELEHSAYASTSLESGERVRQLERATRLRDLQPDTGSHLLGLVLGALSLLVIRSGTRAHERYRVLREISTLQEEVDARARVEQLLEKISNEGIESLTRPERRFLRYASRFYSGRIKEQAQG